MTDVEVLVGQIVPAIGAAVGAYGAGVLTGAEVEAADATVKLGKRLLDRILHRAPDVKRTVERLAEAPDDGNAEAALRSHVRQILSRDAELAADVAGLLPSSATARGEHSVAVGGNVNIQGGPGSVNAWSIGNVTTGNPPQPGSPQG